MSARKMQIGEVSMKHKRLVEEIPSIAPTEGGNLTHEQERDLISRALGDEFRRIREALGWSRDQVVSMLPSRIGSRTLLSYEHGTRNLTMLRHIELCRVYNVAAPRVASRALQRARIHLANLDLQIDLHELLQDKRDKFRPMHQWARNKLAENPGGIIEISPSSVKELATFVGCSFRDLANWMARFLPKEIPKEDQFVDFSDLPISS
jgi:hypothetical protein